MCDDKQFSVTGLHFPVMCIKCSRPHWLRKIQVFWDLALLLQNFIGIL